jgi:histidinol-phosphatase
LLTPSNSDHLLLLDFTSMIVKTAAVAQYFDFMKETAYLAGKLTLGYFQTGIGIEYKADETPVTIADRRAEELIRNRIEKRYPQHEIVGEELGIKESQDSSHRWFIDPIDGTKSFICGVPLYSVLIGLEIDGVIEAGVAYFPALDEMIAAATGYGCWWNGRRAQVSNVWELENAVVIFTSLASFSKYKRAEAWQRIQKACRFSRGNGDAYGYSLVATGRAELMLDPIMSVWDNAPFPVILNEAGGYFGDWQGNETIYEKEGMATSKALLPEVLALIKGRK